MNPAVIVVDANIAFKSLCSGRGQLLTGLGPVSPVRFYAPRFLFVELFKHKERLMKASDLNEEDLLAGLHTLTSRLEFINEVNMPMGTWIEAHRLCRDADAKDTPYVALTLHLDGRLWTEDEELKQGIRLKGFDRFYEP